MPFQIKHSHLIDISAWNFQQQNSQITLSKKPRRYNCYTRFSIWPSNSSKLGKFINDEGDSKENLILLTIIGWGFCDV